MKKIFVAASFLALSLGAFAQDNAEKSTEGFVSKNGHQVLPQAGDWGVSFDAIPVLEFVGNTFSNAGNNSIYAGFPSVGAVTARKFIDANTAYRGMFRFDLGSNTAKFNSSDDNSADPLATVEDKYSFKNTDILLGVGLEKRKGNSRVQGIYGAMATLNIVGSKRKYEYGNAFSASNTTPTSREFGFGNVQGGGAARTLSQKVSNGFGIGVAGFIGAEYFIAPKLSLGAEFMWGPSIQFGGKLKTETEYWDGTGVKTTETETAGGSRIGFNTAVTSINLNFFF